MPTVTRAQHTYIGAEVPLDVAAAFKARAAAAERSATAQLRYLIREFALNDERRPGEGGDVQESGRQPRHASG